MFIWNGQRHFEEWELIRSCMCYPGMCLSSPFLPLTNPPSGTDRLQGTVSFYTANWGLHMVQFWNADVAREREWDNNWLCKSSEEIRGHFLMTREFSFLYCMKITSFMLCLNQKQARITSSFQKTAALKKTELFSSHSEQRKWKKKFSDAFNK